MLALEASVGPERVAEWVLSALVRALAMAAWGWASVMAASATAGAWEMGRAEALGSAILGKRRCHRPK